MRRSVIEFYKRFHGIETITEDMEIDIDCMLSLLETAMKIAIDKIQYNHGEIRDDKVYRAVEHYLYNGEKDNFKR